MQKPCRPCLYARYPAGLSLRAMKRILLVLAALVLLGAGWFLFARTPGGVPVYGVETVATFKHDPQAFTEGLFFHNGVLYEGTGEEGSSGIRKVKLETGEVLQEDQLPAPYFGEGIVAWKDRLYQVTWKDQAGFIYGLDDLAPRGSFAYTGEGWGMTQNGESIILSDGTANLRFLDPDTMAPRSTLAVTANGCPVAKLNELEWIDGQIYANIWQTNLVARIDPKTGHVHSFLDVGALGPKTRGIDDVPNGIAYDAKGKRLFVTGKRWPELYQVKQGAKVDSQDAQTLMSCSR